MESCALVNMICKTPVAMLQRCYNKLEWYISENMICMSRFTAKFAIGDNLISLYTE